MNIKSHISLKASVLTNPLNYAREFISNMESVYISLESNHVPLIR